jgi:hypothetical protein
MTIVDKKDDFRIFYDTDQCIFLKMIYSLDLRGNKEEAIFS